MQKQSVDGGGRRGRGAIECFCVIAACCIAACTNKPAMTQGATNSNAAPASGLPMTGTGGSPAVTGQGGSSPGSTGTSMSNPMASNTGASGGGGATGGAAGGGAGAGTAGMMAGGSGASGGGAAGSGDTSGGAACTRDSLKGAIDSFYMALATHDSSKAPLGASVKFTENGKMMNVGDGIWKTAGMVKFKRSALDTTTCMTATESVLPEGMTDRIYGLRLKLDGGKITEIETIIVRQGDYILNNPAGLSGSASDDWETVLAADKQTPRDKLMMIMDKYLTQFPSGACGFASDCTRLEDGGSVGPCVDGSLVTCSMSAGSGTPVLKPRLHVIDVEAGISVGFTMFLGGYTDFHLFKVRDGEVHSVHAVLATASSSGWD